MTLSLTFDVNLLILNLKPNKVGSLMSARTCITKFSIILITAKICTYYAGKVKNKRKFVLINGPTKPF